eukprot:Sspe_Gene.44416::Locus_21785_Transcript_1_1_Confidence_1.000_Length_3022::g.44416::m.44416
MMTQHYHEALRADGLLSFDNPLPPEMVVEKLCRVRKRDKSESGLPTLKASSPPPRRPLSAVSRSTPKSKDESQKHDRREAWGGKGITIEVPQDAEESSTYHVWYPVETRAGAKGSVGMKIEKKKRKMEFGKELLRKASPNLFLVNTALLEAAEERGGEYRLTYRNFCHALAGIGCDDTDIVRSAFGVLAKAASDPEKAVLPLQEALEAMERLVNGAGRDKCTARAFQLFASLGGLLHYSNEPPAPEFDGVDYIHKAKLLELRRLRVADRMPPRTVHMVKALLQIFGQVQKFEDDKFLEGMVKGKKGKKKKKPPALAPLRLQDEMKDFHRSRHLNLADFRQHMAVNADMVRAFLPIFLRCLVEDPAINVMLTRPEY